MTVIERRISISKDLKIKHLDQAEAYAKKALDLASQSGMAGAQEQLKIERYIVKGLRVISKGRQNTEVADIKQILLGNVIAGMSQAWRDLRKVSEVKFEKYREFVQKWINNFEAASCHNYKLDRSYS